MQHFLINRNPLGTEWRECLRHMPEVIDVMWCDVKCMGITWGVIRIYYAVWLQVALFREGKSDKITELPASLVLCLVFFSFFLNGTGKENIFQMYTKRRLFWYFEIWAISHAQLDQEVIQPGSQFPPSSCRIMFDKQEHNYLLLLPIFLEGSSVWLTSQTGGMRQRPGEREQIFKVCSGNYSIRLGRQATQGLSVGVPWSHFRRRQFTQPKRGPLRRRCPSGIHSALPRTVWWLLSFPPSESKTLSLRVFHRHPGWTASNAVRYRSLHLRSLLSFCETVIGVNVAHEALLSGTVASCVSKMVCVCVWLCDCVCVCVCVCVCGLSLCFSISLFLCVCMWSLSFSVSLSSFCVWMCVFVKERHRERNNFPCCTWLMADQHTHTHTHIHTHTHSHTHTHTYT